MQESAVSPTIMLINGSMSIMTFSTIRPEKTTTSDRASMVIHRVTFCFMPERVVFMARAGLRESLVFSSGMWFFRKLWVRIPSLRAVIGSILRIRRAESHTVRKTVPTTVIRARKNGSGRK